MLTQTNAVTFRQNLGEMLNQVQYRGDTIVINKDGKPVAALIDARLLSRVRAMQGRFETLADRIASAYAHTEGTEADAMAEIDTVVARGRRRADLAPSKVKPKPKPKRAAV
jgi:prevent-host-death family protein